MSEKLKMPPVVVPIDLSKCKVNDKYQRPTTPAHIKRITEAFDPNLVGVLMVSPMGKSGYWVWDGQHRLEVLRKLGYTEWYAIVTDRSPKEQAMDFIAANTNKIRVSAVDKHRASVYTKDPRALMVDKAVEAAGCHVEKSGDWSVPAITACYSAYDSWDYKNLTDTLDILCRVWGASPKGRAAALIGGVSRFVVSMEIQTGFTKVDKQMLVDAIESTGLTPGAFVGKANGMFDQLGGSKGYSQARYLQRVFKKYAGETIQI